MAERDFLISYLLVNKGFATATQIEIKDRYDPNSFETKSNIFENGTVLFTIDELAPGKSVTLNVTVAPKLFGMYESTRASIKYNAGTVIIDDVEDDIRRGGSTSLGRVKIISKAEYERTTASKMYQQILFVTLVCAFLYFPYTVWKRSNALSLKLLGSDPKPKST